MLATHIGKLQNQYKNTGNGLMVTVAFYKNALIEI